MLAALRPVGSPVAGFSCVLAGDPALGEGPGETFEVLDRHVQRGHAEAPHPDPLAEVDPHATPWRTAERHVTVTDAHADPDRRDPKPRSFDPPRRKVGDRCPEMPEPEARFELIVEIDVRRFRPDREEQAE